MSGGVEVRAVDRARPPLATRPAFTEIVLERTTTQLKAHWSEKVFTGAGYPSPAAATLDELWQRLLLNPSRIGFDDATEPIEGLKNLLVVPY